MMYEEQVKKLRELASIPEYCEKVANCDQCSKENICLSFTNKRIIETATQAADAIEELQKLTDAQLDIIKQYQEYLKKSTWIPVTERLPKYGTPVLAYGSRGGIFVAKYERARAEWDRDYWWKLNSSIHVCNPTHWMPLPQPPKEE